jgi:hypothetical protein
VHTDGTHLAAVGGVLVTMPQVELVRFAARIQKASRWFVMEALQYGRTSQWDACADFTVSGASHSCQGGRMVRTSRAQSASTKKPRLTMTRRRMAEERKFCV